MNKENAAAFLPLVQALAEGRTIQFRSSDKPDWRDALEPMFAADLDWRIKPEPREWWICFDRGSQPHEIDSNLGIYDVSQLSIGDHRQQIRVREILD